MAPIKFEEDIKDKLEQRRLEPSSGSWSKLSDRLEEDKQPKSRIVKWLSIAAGILVLVSVSVYFLNKKTDEVVIPEITDKIEKQEVIKEAIQSNKLQNDVQVASIEEVEVLSAKKRKSSPSLKDLKVQFLTNAIKMQEKEET